MRKYPVQVLALIFSLAIASCTDTQEASSDVAPGPTALSDIQLAEIMQGLEADLADAAHGIWVQDRRIVHDAANRIANHPKVTDEQLSAIKRELGDEIKGFVQYDELVHSAAIELAASANSSVDVKELFVIYHKIETGCLNCHASYQKRISEALSISSDG